MNLSLKKERDMGIYVHIPFCKQKCIYCDFAAYPNLDSWHESYVSYLLQEIDLRLNMQSELTRLPVDTIYFGGGTPTNIALPLLERILLYLQERFFVSQDAEISIEANPADCDSQEIQSLRSMGFNRISFGVQTFDDQALKVLGRNHTRQDVMTCLESAYRVGFNTINMDLIYALPGQTVDDVKGNIELASMMPINHVSMYGLQLEEGTYLNTLVKRGDMILPDDDMADAMYDAMIEGLTNSGFERYEISNFAKDNHYSRHNLRYWLYQDYIGFGAGASSFYDNCRFTNIRNVVPYMNTIKKDCLPEELVEDINQQRSMEDFCFLGLRTKWGIQEAVFQSRFGSSLLNHFGSTIKCLLIQGLLHPVDGGYALTDLGAKHGNYVFEQFIDG